MLRMHHAVFWWASPPSNGMTSHLLDSCVAKPHHKKSFRCNPSLINSKKFLSQQTQRQHNSCGRYHPGWCNRIRYWWRLVPYRQSINIQRLHKRGISFKCQILSWCTISTCPLKFKINLHRLWRKFSLCVEQWMIYTEKYQIGCRSTQKN